MTGVLDAPDTHRPAVPPTADATTLSPGWWAAGLTLAERCALPGRPGPAPDAAERTEGRLARWRDAYRLGESGQFDRRLAAAGLTEATLRELLAERPADLAARAVPPGWAASVEAAVARLSDGRSVPDPAGPEPVAWREGFHVIVSPFVELAYERLAAAVTAEGLDELADLAQLRGGFIGALASSLLSLACRTLVLELNVLRVTDRLSGDTPQQRYWSFVRHFATPAGFTALVQEYPVLARLLSQAAGHAVDSRLELLRRLRADRPRIVAEVLGGTDPGRLVELAADSGDAHQRGRSVALLRFAEGARLVYKPRAQAAHVHFNLCVDWLNRLLPDLELRTLAVLDRQRYGWVELAEHLPCQDRAGLERYFRRQGALLALLYALDGADFHFENLIANGDQPVLVDLEALLHPAVPAGGSELVIGDPARAAQEASVFRVGLLPAFIFGDDGTALDISGNGGDPGQPMPFKAVGWSAAGTDEMRLVREKSAFPGSQNKPRLAEVDVDSSEFTSQLVDGFRTAYDAIAADRDELVRPAGLLRRFADDELRVVVRATREYAVLLYESTHPDVLRDALDRDRTFDYLWALSAGDPTREGLVAHEHVDLWAGDVPLFTTRPATRDVWTSDGVRLRDVLRTSSLARATGKVQALGPVDRDTQEWMIEAAFATRRASTGVRDAAPPPVPGPPAARTERLDPQRALAAEAGGVDPERALAAEAGGVDPERALAAARAVGDRLAETAYLAGDRVGWLGLHFVDEAQWMVRPLGFDLYGGYPGVALFLSQLATVTGEQRYADLAYRALAPLQELVDGLTDASTGRSEVSAFNALTGLAYGLLHVGTNVAAPDLLAMVEPLVAAVVSRAAEDTLLDVIGGSAGGLVAMLAIHQVTGLASALEVAGACADRLVATAEPQPHGVAWPAGMQASQPLAGLSHGAAGMGWALLRYAAATGSSRYADVGLDAFRYERSLYSPAIRNWPDFRVADGRAPAADGSPPSMHAWCHGSPGVGLARADSRHLHLPELAADLELAVDGLLRSAPVANLSLCHGQLGNLELLTVARGGSAERAAWAARALSTWERYGPVCGTPGGTATPGLMLGLAGIGHGLLRLGIPDQVPSALLFQPPRVRPS